MSRLSSVHRRFAALCERLLGYELAGSWRLYRTDPAERQGHMVPGRIPVPRDVWRTWGRGQRPSSLSHAQIAEFAQRFIDERPGHAIVPELRTFVTKAPLARQVEEALQRKAWKEAETHLREVLELDPRDGRALVLLGLCLQNQGRLDEAEHCYEQASPRMDADADFHAFRGGLMEMRQQIPEAKTAYQEALRRESDHPVALERLAAMGDMMEIFLGDLDDPQKAYLPMETYERAIEEGWEKEPRSIQFYLERSEFHLRNGQPSLALKAADRAEDMLAADLSAPAVEVLAARCRALIAGERYEEAGEAVARLQQLAPESEATFSCLGQLFWFRGEKIQSAEWVTRAIRANPNRVENLHLFLNPEFPRREKSPFLCLRKLMKDHPQSWAVKSLMASLSMTQGNWKDGVALAIEAASLGAADEMLIELTGRMGRQGLHEDVTRLADAAGGWRRFLKANPLLRSNLAASQKQTGRPEAARTLWRSVLEDDSAHPDIRLRAREALG